MCVYACVCACVYYHRIALIQFNINYFWTQLKKQSLFVGIRFLYIRCRLFKKSFLSLTSIYAFISWSVWICTFMFRFIKRENKKTKRILAKRYHNERGLYKFVVQKRIIMNLIKFLYSYIYIYIYIYIYRYVDKYHFLFNWAIKYVTVSFMHIFGRNDTHASRYDLTFRSTRNNSIVRRYLQGVGFHTQRKDATNTKSIWCPERISFRDNDALKNTKAIVRSIYDDIDFFDIVVGVFQGDTPATYMFITCLD